MLGKTIRSKADLAINGAPPAHHAMFNAARAAVTAIGTNQESTRTHTTRVVQQSSLLVATLHDFVANPHRDTA